MKCNRIGFHLFSEQKALFEPAHRKTLDNRLLSLPAHPRRQISIFQQYSNVYAQFIGIDR
jgi:hypothetical protein